MARRNNPLSRIRLVYRRSKPLTKMAVAVAIVLSIAALISLGAAKSSAQARAAELRTRILAQMQENEQLREDISQLGTSDSVKKIAWEELDLVMPGTVFFRTGE